MITHEIRCAHPDAGSAGAPTHIVWNLTEGIRIDMSGAAEVGRGVGPFVVGEDVEGLGDPEVDVFALSTPRSPGQRRTGSRAKTRSAFLPIVFEQLGQAWIDAQRLWWRCFSPDRPVQWRVVLDDGTWRELNVYLDPKDTIYSRNPTQIRQVLGLALEADEPYWLGPEQVALTSTQAGTTPFFGELGDAPPFYIQPAASTAGDAFQVMGDESVWPVLQVVGPASSFQVLELFETVGVVGAINVPAGQQLVINFDPTSQAAMLRPIGATSGGTNVTNQLTQRAFFPVEPTFSSGAQVVLLAMLGAGYARLTYRPKYRRAF